MLRVVPQGGGKASVKRGQKLRALPGETVHQQLESRVADEIDPVPDQMGAGFFGGVELSVKGKRHAEQLADVCLGLRVERDRSQADMAVAGYKGVRFLPGIVPLARRHGPDQ